MYVPKGKFAIQIKRSEIALFCLMIPFCEPYCISILFPFIHRIFIMLKVISAVVILLQFMLKFLNRRKKEHIDGYVVLVFVFWTYLYLNTLFQVGNNLSLIIGAVSIIAVMLLIEMYIEQISSLLNVFFFILEILIYINLALMILIPSGLYVTTSGNTNNWLLGYDNFFAQTFIPGMTLAYLKIAYRNGPLRALFLVIAINISTFLTVPKTLLVAIVFLDFVFFLGMYKFKRIFNLKVLFIVLSIISIGIVFWDMASYFSFFIEGILGKDISFTGRTKIWSVTIKMVAEEPIFGYGFVDGLNRVAMMSTNLRGAYNAHNQILELLWEGGVILLVIFVVMIGYIIRRMKSIVGMQSTQCLIIGMSAFLIIFIDQAILQMWPIWYFVLLSLTCHADKINETLEGHKK